MCEDPNAHPTLSKVTGPRDFVPAGRLLFHGLHNMAGLSGYVALHAAEMPDNGAQTAFLRRIGGMLQLVIEKSGICINLQLQQFQQF